MTTTTLENIRVTLNQRPNGLPQPDDFRIEKLSIPTLKSGEILLRTLYLSLDPYMRNRMDDHFETHETYVNPLQIGEVILGSTISVVEQSQHADFKVGEVVLANSGWQTYLISDGVGVQKIDKNIPKLSLALSLFGLPAFTAYYGMLNIGQPKQGETVVISSATGAIGSVAGQIAKLKGAKVIGIAGGERKCQFAVETLGFDACLDYRAKDFSAQLKKATPDGIDVYFENVGGEVFEAVFPLLNLSARVPLCGLISYYNEKQLPIGTLKLSEFLYDVLLKQLKIQPYIITDYYPTDYDDFLTDVSDWSSKKLITQQEDIVQGIEHAPQAFIGLLSGKHLGKVVVQVSEL